jgi:hypothetical protein
VVEELPAAGCKKQRRKHGHNHVELMQGPVHPLSKPSLCLVILRLFVVKIVFGQGGPWISSVFGGQLERKCVFDPGPVGKLQILPQPSPSSDTWYWY